MSKIFRYIALLLTVPFLIPMLSCSTVVGASDNVPQMRDFWMIGVIQSVGDRIEIEVIEGEYAYGTYWIIYDSAELLDDCGNIITVKDLNKGDKIKISYGGQVMMSYPPQVAAYKITLIK